MTSSGIIQKLKALHKQPIEYDLPIGDKLISLNPLIGQEISLEFTGNILCIHCGRTTKKSFQQGYCFVCAQKLARCDICIVRPEKCHHHLGTCREPEWAKSHCFIPHCIYLANTSGLKVGITRETQIPTRWIDQGATQALIIARVQSRYHAGLIEVALSEHFADKTDWRAMLKGKPEMINLKAKAEELIEHNTIAEILKEKLNAMLAVKTISAEEISVEEADFYPKPVIDWCEESTYEFEYPVLSYLEKISSISLDKTPSFSSKLIGIKGQYLIFEKGVLNVRNLSGYEVSLEY